MSDEKSFVDILRDPEIYYPGNCDTPQRMNALLAGLCQEAADKIEELRSDKNEFIRLTEEEIETCWGEPEVLNKQALINFANAIMDALEEPISRPFVRLTDEELLKLGGDHVGPMSDGEFHLMVITQEALAEKNK